MEKWAYTNIPDQSGRTAIVTGANSGLGYYTSKGLAEKGCYVIMACRSLERGEEARSKIVEELPEAKVEVMKLDLGNLKSVNDFAKEFNGKYNNLDLLINNAGLMAIPYRKTVDGFEMQFGVNHLGHFALSGLLFETIAKTPESRIINVSSTAHRFGEIRFDDIHWEKGYSKWRAYGMSKLANLLFTYELADRIEAAGLNVAVLAAHPGYADSKLIEKGPEMNGRNLLVKAGRLVNSIFAQSTAMGALPTLYAATNKTVDTKDYYGPGGISEMRGYPKLVRPNQKKINKSVQEKLWDLSETLTGVPFHLT